ncbi:hypothetical protein V6N12_011496 [Hibiscus sabdariffa]|uniref:Uncharacterized protein n=1 Tax=Hibiscus sabdariffa TaxID=183260 RepID=A0ABR2B2X6_9ROSI
MALVSFIGRVLFASVFILSAWQELNEFGVDGGPAGKELTPKFDVFSSSVSAHARFLQGPEFYVLHQLILTPVLYEFGLLFEKLSQDLALLGALLFFIGMKKKYSFPGRQLRIKAPKPNNIILNKYHR